MGDRRSDNSEYGHVGTAITFLLVGMGVGSLIALLLAPKSGKQLRRDIRRSYLDARGAVEDFAAETRERVEDAIERGSDWVDDLEETARKRVAPLERALRRER